MAATEGLFQNSRPLLDAGPPVVGRVGAENCPESLAPGERVSVRFTMGLMMRVAREVG